MPSVHPSEDDKLQQCPGWIVKRLDDNGNIVEVTRTSEKKAAEKIAMDFEAKGHKQMYWVEKLMSTSQ
jgi:hypothetical protein